MSILIQCFHGYMFSTLRESLVSVIMLPVHTGREEISFKCAHTIERTKRAILKNKLNAQCVISAARDLPMIAKDKCWIIGVLHC